MLITTYKLNNIAGDVTTSINNNYLKGLVWPFYLASTSLPTSFIEVIMSLVLVSKSASFLMDTSMFVVNGNYEDGYVYDKDVFFMLGLKINEDYCFVGQDDIIITFITLRVGGDASAGFYEAKVYDEWRTNEILDWTQRSILAHWFKHDLNQYDFLRRNAKASNLLPDFLSGFYMPNDLLEEFVKTFPEFQPV